MAESTTTLSTLQQRVAQRLADALDAAGFPAQRADRSRQLASSLAVDVTTALALVTGHALPDYPQLLALCQLTGRQPGFFLDAQLPAFPAGTLLVKAVGPGEDLAVRLPAGLADGADAGGLIYHQAKVRHGYGIEAGDYLIAHGTDAGLPASADALYLFFEDGGAAVRRCVEVNKTMAVFQGPAQSEVPVILPIVTRPATAGATTQYSQIVANLRGGRDMHRLA